MKTPTPSASDPILGKLIGGRYRVIELIGDGGMCSVYRAEDRERKAIALKVLPRERAAEPEMVARFQREATVGKRITHQHVVGISDSGALDDGSLFLAMEMIEGRSLAALLDEKGRLPLRRAVDIAQQMLSGLEAAHELGIVHRDIKPGNVILVESEEKDTVKLIDFGIASNERAAIKLTVAGIAFGTPEYISPEMAMGVPVDARADLYSVGVVLFQMVTGQLPFSGRNPKEMMRAHVDQAPPRLRAVAPDLELPAALEEVTLRALAKLPEERFSSASTMRRALGKITLPRPTRGARRWLWLGLLLAAAVAIAATWWFRIRLPPKPASPIPAQPAPKTKHHAAPSHR